MQKYQNAIQDVHGNAVASATVTVYVYGTLTPATIYSDNGLTVIPSSQVTTDSDGQFYFYADNGRYTLSVMATGFAQEQFSDVSLFDQADAGIASVKDYGAVGDGVTDDTDAIQAAINAVGAAGGGCVTIPSGIYKITSALNISSQSIRISGENQFASQIYQETANSVIFNVTAYFAHIEHLSTYYTATPTAGAVAILVNGGYFFRANDFVVRNGYYGIELTNSTAANFTNFAVLDFEQIGIYAHETGDVFVSKFLMNPGNKTRGVLGAIRLYNKVEAAIFCDGDIILGKYSITMDAASNAQNVRPAYNKFTNIYFDSSDYGTYFDKSVETQFVNCWFSNGRKSDSGSALTVDQPGCNLNGSVDSFGFTECQFFNSGADGCKVQETAKRITFKGCNFESNSVSAGVGVAHGLNIMANTTDFIVSNCVAHNGLYTGQQGWGVIVNSGTSDRYIVADNLVSGNYTGGVSDGGSGVNKRVASNY